MNFLHAMFFMRSILQFQWWDWTTGKKWATMEVRQTWFLIECIFIHSTFVMKGTSSFKIQFFMFWKNRRTRRLVSSACNLKLAMHSPVVRVLLHAGIILLILVGSTSSLVQNGLLVISMLSDSYCVCKWTMPFIYKCGKVFPSSILYRLQLSVITQDSSSSSF